MAVRGGSRFDTRDRPEKPDRLRLTTPPFFDKDVQDTDFDPLHPKPKKMEEKR